MYITSTELWILFLCCIIAVVLIAAILYEYEKLSKRYELMLEERNRALQAAHELRGSIIDLFYKLYEND